MREKLYTLLEDGKYAYTWSFAKAKKHLDIHCKKEGITKVSFYKTISEECFITEEAVKNWFTGKNGPKDIFYADTLASHFGIDRMDLLYSYDKETDELIDDLANQVEPAEFMLNYTTLKFISMLNSLAEETRFGYCGFSKYTPNNDKDPIIYIDEEGPNFGKIVMDMCVGEEHHDIISTYDYYVPEATYDARVVTIEDESFIEITTPQGSIVVEDGRWYCC